MIPAWIEAKTKFQLAWKFGQNKAWENVDFNFFEKWMQNSVRAYSFLQPKKHAEIHLKTARICRKFC